MPAVAHRAGLRACAAIGAGCRRAMETDERGVARIDPTRAAIVRLGNEAATELAAIPDTPVLQADDRVFVAPRPLAPDCAGGPIVRQMRRLVERYRQECNIEGAGIALTIAAAYARCLALPAADQADDQADDTALEARRPP